jgi:hypothetical protein
MQHANISNIESFSEIVDGDIQLARNLFTNVKFLKSLKKLTGSLDFRDCHVTSLEGCPKEINGSFDCSDNQLESLKYGPEKTYDYRCNNNCLTSLEYAPKTVIGTFACSDNNLKNLDGCPEELQGHQSGFFCNNNEQLTSLKGIPKHIPRGIIFFQNVNKFN